MDVHKDVYTDVYTDVRMESRNALDGLKSKISPLRFRCTEREVCSSNISRVMGGHGEIILIKVPVFVLCVGAVNLHAMHVMGSTQFHTFPAASSWVLSIMKRNVFGH